MSGEFLTKSTVYVDQYLQHSSISPLGKLNPNRIWSSNIHERFILFIWKIAWNSLPIGDVIKVRILIEDVKFPICNVENETLENIFL